MGARTRKWDAEQMAEANAQLRPSSPAGQRKAAATRRKYRATLAQLKAWYGEDAALRDDYRTITRYLEGNDA